MKNNKPKRRVPQEVRDAYAVVGSFGGKTTARKLGRKGMSELGKRGAAKRWPKKKA